MTKTHRLHPGSAVRTLAVCTALAMLASLAFASTVRAQEEPDDGTQFAGVFRLEADNNVDAAVALSQFTFETVTALPPETVTPGPVETGTVEADRALLTREGLFVDSLASSSLQNESDPLLLTNSTTLSSATADELERLDIETVTILGGFAAVAETVEDELEDLGYDVERVFGAERVETSIEVASEFDDPDTVIIARAYGDTGDDAQAFIDSLTVGGLAADSDDIIGNVPVVVTDGAELSAIVSDYLDEVSPEQVAVIGGTEAISQNVRDEIQAKGINIIQQTQGANRFDTAVNIAGFRGFENSSEADRILLGDGNDLNAWAPGFAAAAQSGLFNAPIVLSAGETLPPETQNFLVESPETELVCLPFVSAAACDAAAQALGKADADVGDGADAVDLDFVVLNNGTPAPVDAAGEGGPVLVSYSTQSPETPETFTAIAGLPLDVELRAIDFRPANGELFSLGSDGQVYVIDFFGADTVPGSDNVQVAQAEARGEVNPNLVTETSTVGFDFNPVGDALRITEQARNFRYSPETGNPAGGPPDAPLPDGTPEGGSLQYVDGDENVGAEPSVTAVGYTNATEFGDGPVLPTPRMGMEPGTVQFVLDTELDVLVQQDPPNAGDLTTLGALGVDAESNNGFDVATVDGDNFAFAALTVDGQATLYSLDIDFDSDTQGTATDRGSFPEGAQFDGFAFVPPGPGAPGDPGDPDEDDTDFFALNAGVESNVLVGYGTEPGADGVIAPTETVDVDGVNEGTELVGIDVRPSDGLLYLLGTDGQLYSADLDAIEGDGDDQSLTADAVGDPDPENRGSAILAADGVGFDFNPVGDLLRIVAGDANFRVQADDGSPAGGDPDGSAGGNTLSYTDGTPGDPNASATAYTNAVTPSPRPGGDLFGTEQYILDLDLGILGEVENFNAGEVVDAGELGVEATATNGFDVFATAQDDDSEPDDNTAFAVLSVDGQTGLYTIVLDEDADDRGNATLVGNFPEAAPEFAGLAFLP